MVEGDSQIFKVFTLDRGKQRRSLPSRSLTFQFTVEDFKVLAQDRIRQRHLLLSLQLVRMMTRMSLVKGFFRVRKKCEGDPALECVPRHVSSSTLSAHQMAPGSSAVLGSQDERTEMVDDNGNACVRLDTVHGSFWKNLDTQHSQWHPSWRS